MNSLAIDGAFATRWRGYDLKPPVANVPSCRTRAIRGVPIRLKWFWLPPRPVFQVVGGVADDGGVIGERRTVRWVRWAVPFLLIASVFGAASLTDRTASSSGTADSEAGAKTSTKQKTAQTTVKGPTTLQPRSPRPYDAQLRSTVASLNRQWKNWLPEYFDVEYEPLAGGLFAYRSDSVTPECDGTRLPYIFIQENAFFCPEDDLIAWDDEGLFPRLAKEHGTLLLSVVLAHEWGHAIQQRADLFYELDTIVSEQQADCFAGAWLAGLDPNNPGERELIALRDKELDASLGGFVEFRDIVGMSALIAGSHGTAFDRMRAFQEGYESGAGKCGTYVDERPDLVGFEFRNLKERFRGGNLPFPELVSSTIASLEGSKSTTVKVRFVEDTPTTPPCNRPQRFSGLIGKAVSGCLDGAGSVRYRRAQLQKWFDEFGDFAPATVLSLGWASIATVSEEAGLATGDLTSNAPTTIDPVAAIAAERPTTTPPADPSGLPLSFDRSGSFAADCLAGRWTAELVDLKNPEASVLSPGDLDEAAQTLLKLAAAEKKPGRGFERVRAFRIGLITGSCDASAQAS